MLRRLLACAVIAAALATGVASATSLGNVSPTVATGLAQDVDQCAATVDPLDSSLASLPVLGGLVLPFTIDLAAFSGIDASCDGGVPTIVIIGFPPLGSAEEVLATIAVPPLDDAGGVGQTIDVTDTTLPVGAVVTDVRVAYSPY